MTEMPLTGLRVLVVEDEYYLATDASAAIEGAGGKVIGPFGMVNAALAALDADGADLAVIDINLGDGPAYDLAYHLSSANLTFIFATGYDDAAIPDDLKNVLRLEKPFSAAQLISAAAMVHEAANVGGR